VSLTIERLSLFIFLIVKMLNTLLTVQYHNSCLKNCKHVVPLFGCTVYINRVWNYGTNKTMVSLVFAVREMLNQQGKSMGMSVHNHCRPKFSSCLSEIQLWFWFFFFYIQRAFLFFLIHMTTIGSSRYM